MPRSRILGIYVLLGVAALGAGMLVAKIFGTSSTLPSGYTTPTTAVAQAAPTAAARPTAAHSNASTPAPAGVPTVPPSTVPPDPTLAPTVPPDPTLVPTEPPTAASDPGYIEYTVQRGDILKEIARQYGVTIEAILAINQIPNPDSLVVASVIHIPKK